MSTGSQRISHEHKYSEWSKDIPEIRYEQTPDQTSDEENSFLSTKFVFNRLK